MPFPGAGEGWGSPIAILRGIELKDLPAIPVKDQELVIGN